MGNEPLTFYFLWVSGWETLEKIFSIILVEWFFSPQAESRIVHTGLSHQLNQIKSQKNELV